MDRIYGFEPVWSNEAVILILGSMPSVESLKQDFYYAHPRNAFWRIVSTVLRAPFPASIEEKKDLLIKNHIALWDTVGSCVRVGSLDSNITEPKANNFVELYKCCPQIQTILFNGGTAERLYYRLVGKNDRYVYIRLPSTSPAYTMKYEKKLAEWERVLREAINHGSL